MQSLGASRVALSSITSKKLWQQSGRYEKLGSELFNFQDRRGADYMLAPTHEEEVTSLVAQSVKSYKELPLRLYQMTRKYRDELRPRHGLLRTREFTMKDLYTFDVDTAAAMQTYEQVQDAYASFFGSLGLPVVKARAGSGDMGGDLSHEYHFTSPIGEDLIMKCEALLSVQYIIVDHSKMASQGGETVNLSTLDVQQLGQVKKQIEEELEHLTQSFAQLHAVQGKFKECQRIVKTRPGSTEGERSVLVPLTNSLYVRGELSDPGRVIVDVGTGFYVEKESSAAELFYNAKIQQLAQNIQDLEVIVQRKTANVRSVEDVLRQKVMAGQATETR
ncbi:proline--tRNA ligase like protein [Verticillium longisporum]|nr:proline--tRNA ligase like protein [Verticillium longisporum]